MERVGTVVIGSGFGGAVVASRLAAAGREVVVLERGRAYPPGSFPRSPRGAARNYWEPEDGLHGLYDVWSFHRLEAIVAAGLGGGSLIYSNVLLRKDEAWFEDGGRPWPVTRAELEPHYDRVEAELRPVPYPYADTPKTVAMAEAARARGHEPLLPPLAVTFAPREGADPVRGEPIAGGVPSLHGRTRLTCRLCGACNAGCNDGSKNTLDHTYLSMAARDGADIRTGWEARGLARHPAGGYVVHTWKRALGHPDEDAPPPSPVELHADRVVVAAGVFGSTRLLLRSRSHLPALSSQLGERFSGNGDFLVLALRCRRAGRARALDPSTGPVITTAVRVADELDGAASGKLGHYVQDGGWPESLGWVLNTLESPRLLWRWRGAALRIALQRLGSRRRWPFRRRGAPHANLGGELAALCGDSGLSAGTLPLLCMGREVPNGRLALTPDDDLELRWTAAGSRDFYSQAIATASGLARELGGVPIVSPTWRAGRVATVHPLGGCPMGRSADEGVVDPNGEVFGHPGLYVVDGSVMPGPVGPNPAFTIAAFADRAADRMLGEV